MSEKSLIPVEAQDKITEALVFTESIKEVIISTPSQLETVNTELKEVKAFLKELETFKKSAKEPHYGNYKKVLADFKPVEEALENGEKIYKLAIGKYSLKLKAEAKIKQDKEDARVAAIQQRAEKKRDKELKKAEKLEKDGDHDSAAIHFARADSAEHKAVTTVANEVKVVEAKGISVKEITVAEVTDPIKVMKFVLKNQTVKNIVTFDTSLITKQYDDFEIKIPGVKYSKKNSVTSRSK